MSHTDELSPLGVADRAYRIRAAALNEAIRVFGDIADADHIVTGAKAFEAYLNGETVA